MESPAPTVRYRPHPAMELAVFVGSAFYGYVAVRETGSARCVLCAGFFLLAILFWFSLQRVAVSAETVVVSRRFGLFRRRIPMGNIKNVVAILTPSGRGSVPLLVIHVADERPCKVNLYSHGRHLRVLRHVRTLMARREDSAGGGDPPPSAP